ncbi:MAG: RNA polymerase sigma factor, sigma-70 family [Candidatus Doudnabacteria bacterium Gr01-1014_77]|uniref:RNA polymerase sigma factor, sigma-70 family n=1 Tax=Candidatus Doudnabacteria bacterium Gr01-1014_77 TaxID=2017133 RepID=A0A554JBB8_9BACT|nr:MAG: RNA polymerase sigma factor, sigma-70 family [Candidatus Doudnabacteria bacterium Gr01-1014_77]
MAKRSVSVRSPDAMVLGASDQELVQRFLAGDEFAFKELYNRNRKSLLEFAFQLVGGDSDAAEEISETCWLKILRSLDTFSGRGSFRGWAGTILRNIFKDQFKKGEYKYCETHPPCFEFEEWCPAHPSMDPLEELIYNEEMDRVMARLGSLPDGIRRTFVIVHFEGRSYNEAARLLRINVGALKMRLVRARRALREVIAEQQ